ncbi:hypothetical protein C8Q75DRAFT_726448 [Abortiporus biennis]|nr:hypothetical protein C8Q75DRAFT_726448 [Abortiporus biennis]
MSSNVTNTTLPNPFTPLAFLPPDIAHQVQVAQLLIMTVIGAWMWDYLMSLYEEYSMFTKHKLALSDLVYALSRIVAISYIAVLIIYVGGPIAHTDCNQVDKAATWTGVITMSLNCLLFFFRVRAVFFNYPYIVGFYFFLWLCTLGGIAVTGSIHGANVGPTNICQTTNVKPYMSAEFILVGVHDTLVYIGITIRLMILSSNVYIDTNSTKNVGFVTKVKTFFRGDGTSRLTKALIQSGQLYYLATVGVNLIAMVANLAPWVPEVYRAMLTIPDVAIQNAMACRVYRQLKIGRITENATTADISTIQTTIRFSGRNTANMTDVGRTTAHCVSCGSTLNVRGIRVDPVTISVPGDNSQCESQELSYLGKKDTKVQSEDV